MESTDRELKAVFCEAIDRPAGPEREAYLDQIWPFGTPMRARVEALIRADEAASRIPGPSAGQATTLADPTKSGADQTTAVDVPGTVLDSAQTTTGSFAAKASETADQLVLRLLTEGPGTRVGPFKVLHKIGEGGMGLCSWPNRSTQSVATWL
jgi:hypothetical protein